MDPSLNVHYFQDILSNLIFRCNGAQTHLSSLTLTVSAMFIMF